MDLVQKEIVSTQQKSARNSSIELLRILSACAVVLLHYNGMGKALSVSTGASHHILLFFESLCVCAVDLFIMISGYFMCKTQKRTWDKPIYLILLLSIVSVFAYIVKTLVLGKNMSFITMAHLIIPPQSWFLLLYVSLYIISPYINVILNRLQDKGRTIMLLVMILLFSIYTTFIDEYQLFMHHDYMGISTVGAWGQQHGYTIVNFVLCYCLGAYLRMNRFAESISKFKIIIGILISVLFVYLWYLAESYIFLHNVAQLIEFNAFSYSNPIVLLLGLLVLLLFTKIRFQNKLINTLSKAAFTCYIFHLSVIPFLNVESYASKGGLVLFIHLSISIVFIYFASWLIWRLFDFVLTPITNKLRNKVIFDIYEQ